MDDTTDTHDTGPRVTRDEVRDLGRMRRSRTDRHVAGVAGGLARHLDIDPVILRVAFVVLTFFGGSGLLAYLALWLLVPEEGRDDAPVDLDPRTRTVALVGVGVLAALAMVGDWSGAFWFPWPLVPVALAAVLVYAVASRSRRDRTPPPGTAGAAGPAAYGSAGWTPPPPRPRDPRRRGPLLFWPTLALAALGIGVLASFDVAGWPVVDSAYPALVLGVVATMLLVGATWGRAGGLIALGLVAAVATAATTVAGEVDGDRVRWAPTSAEEVRSSYSIDRGELVVDLTRISDLEALDGRVLRVEGDVGRLEVVVPEELTVAATADVDGPGSIDLFDQGGGGIDTSYAATHDGPAGAPSIDLDTDLDVGEIVVRVE